MTGTPEIIRVREWIDSRTPRPPAELAGRLAEIVREDTCAAGDLAEILAGKAMLIIRSAGNDRTHALDLLAADALITYAMEAAVELNPDPEVVASRMMQQLSSQI